MIPPVIPTFLQTLSRYVSLSLFTPPPPPPHTHKHIQGGNRIKREKMVEKPKGRKEVVTREYTINLHKRLHGCTFKKKAPKAIKEIRRFAVDVKQGYLKCPRAGQSPNSSRKRNDDEDAKEELYSVVTVAEIPAEGRKGVGTKIIEED
ncbi:hypothetical protein Pfo_003750 [Paulownia fortunei]|nr:hypothetical protein Pfo_003750 [Paulownia fortunei]